MEEVKAKTPEELLKEQLQLDPFEAAAKIYENFIPRFDMLLHKVGKKGLARVLSSIIKVPLVEVNFKLDKDETELALTCERMLECKFLMTTQILSQHLSQEGENNNG